MLGEQSLHDDDTMDDETDQHPSGDDLHADVRAPEQRADGQDHEIRITTRGNQAEETVERPPHVHRDSEQQLEQTFFQTLRDIADQRSEEHKSELQSLMRTSYA